MSATERMQQRRLRLIVSLFVIGGIILTIGGGFFLLRQRHQPPPFIVRTPEFTAFAEPALVRVISTYYAEKQGVFLPIDTLCTGVGTLVSSGNGSVPYVLTDAQIVSPLEPCQAVQTAYLGHNQTPPDAWKLTGASIIMGSAYTGYDSAGTVAYSLDLSTIPATGVGSGIVLLPLSTQLSYELPMLALAPPGTHSQAIVDLGASDGTPFSSQALTSEASAGAGSYAFSPALSATDLALIDQSAFPSSPLAHILQRINSGAPLIADDGSGQAILTGIVEQTAAGPIVINSAALLPIFHTIGIDANTNSFDNMWHTALHVYYLGDVRNSRDPKFTTAANLFIAMSNAYPDFTALRRWISLADAGNPDTYQIPDGDTTMHASLALSGYTSIMLTLILFGGVIVVIAVFFTVTYLNRKRLKTMMMGIQQTDLSQTGVVPALEKDFERVLHPTRPRDSLHSHVQAMPISYDVGYGIDRGIRRRSAVNQDSILAVRGGRVQRGTIEPFGIFIVADGMGGHLYGSEASKRATKVMLDYLVQPLVDGTEMDDAAMLNLVKMSVNQANVDIHLRNLRKSADMGTTVTAAMITGTHVIIVNVGDSRTYHIPYNGHIYPVTSDHSIVAGLVSAGLITPDEIYTHPRRNQIYRSLGEKDTILIDSYTLDLDVGDTLVLCSDGLWEMVRDNTIEDLLRTSHSAQEAAEQLVHEANENGGVDNISTLVVHILETDQNTLQLGYSIVAGPDAGESD